MKKLKLSESLKNVTKISTGNVVGQIIAIVTLPFISRIYGAEIIGIWAVITALANIVSNISDLGLANSLMMCGDNEIIPRYSIVSKISMYVSMLSGVVVFLYYILTGQELQYSITVCGFLIMYTFTLRQVQICYTLLSRYKEYSILMMNSAIRFGSVAVISIGLGMLGFIQYGYFIGNVAGQILTLLHMRKKLPKIQKKNKISEYTDVIKGNIDYVRYQMPASITVMLRTELPNLLIGALFGNKILGYFSISQKLLTIPVTFIGQSLGTVFYQRAAEMSRLGQNIGQFLKRNINRSMLLAVIPMTLFAAFGDVAINIFFGVEYSVGGVICRIIVFRSLFNFISTATRGLDIVINKQQYVLYTCIAQTILAVGSVLCGFYVFHDIIATSIILVVTFIIIQIMYFCFMYKFIGLNPLIYLRDTAIIVGLMFALSIVLRYAVIWILQAFPNGFFNYLLSMFVL